MDTQKLKKIITDQKEEAEELLKQESFIERDLDLLRLKRYLSKPNLLVISGVRRCGKSILALLILRGEKFGYLNFDDERLAGFTHEDFDALLEAFYWLYGEDLEYFIFDEIQDIEKWQFFINRLRRRKKIIVTGSNAKLLGGELSTHLTGRYLDFTLWPFSFREYLRFKKVSLDAEALFSTKKISQIKKSLSEYLTVGGFPEAYSFGKGIVQRIYGDIVNKDILFRHKIRHKTTFKELSNYLMANFSHEMSYSKLKNIFGIKNIHTVKNYVNYLSESFLVFAVEKFSFKLKQQILAAKKIYGIDPGLIDAMSFQSSQNSGKILENTVFLELWRRKSYFGEDISTYFWKDYSGKEVDIVVKKGKNIIFLIQVCYSLSSMGTRDREFDALLRASKELRCNQLMIITADESGEEIYKGKKIQLVPLWQWLVKEH